jgi:hypothetical protein
MRKCPGRSEYQTNIKTGMNNKISKQESECGLSAVRKYFIDGMSKRGKGMIEKWVAKLYG